jgi:hypothetical protein
VAWRKSGLFYCSFKRYNMKARFSKGFCIALLAVFALVQQGHAQTDSAKQYTIVDLGTGQPIDIYYDNATWRTMNRMNKAPIEFYVVNGVDTVHGATGLVVNNMLVKNADGAFALDAARVKVDGDEIKMKMSDGRKIKWENGKMKIKDWSGKEKIKGDKHKIKDVWTTAKWKESDWTPEYYDGRM